MPYYELSNDSIQNALAIANKVQFTGSEAFKILELFKALQDDTNKPYYTMEEELAKFFLGKINQTTFIGAHAILLSKIIISLNKPLKEMPKQPPKPKNMKPKLEGRIKELGSEDGTDNPAISPKSH